jgi:trehalose-6-phosphate synthase
MARKKERMSLQIEEERLLSVSSEALHADHFIIATARGPVESSLTREGKLKHRRGAGGVVTALLGTNEHRERTWIALAMTDGVRRAVHEQGTFLAFSFPHAKASLCIGDTKRRF